MSKEQSSKESVEQIMWDVCGIKKTEKKKNKKNKGMVESEIDLFADDDGKDKHKN